MKNTTLPAHCAKAFLVVYKWRDGCEQSNHLVLICAVEPKRKTFLPSGIELVGDAGEVSADHLWPGEYAEHDQGSPNSERTARPIEVAGHEMRSSLISRAKL